MTAHNEKCLLSLAIGGIQGFVYDIKSKGAAKRLRFRSAILLLAPAVIAVKIKTEDPDAHIHYLGASQLTIEATQTAVQNTEAELRELRQWLATVSGGILNLYWAITPRTQNLAKDIQEARKNLSLAKWKAFRESNNWLNLLEKINQYKTQGHLGDEEWESTQGGRMPREEWKGFRLSNQSTNTWQISHWHLLPVTEAPCDIPLPGTAQDGQPEVAIPLYAPQDEDGSVTELEVLAEKGDGAPYLAVLKLDGDSIGARLNQTLNEDSSGKKYSKLSQRLNTFFGSGLQNLLKQCYPMLYLVYSGGDDLVLVGHFWETLQAARTIQEKLQAHFSGEITASAGIAGFHKRAPLISAIHQANAYLDTAKNQGKDRICAFGVTLIWKEFEQALTTTEELVDAVRSEHVPRGSLQFLKVLGNEYLEANAPALSIKKPPEAVFPKFHYFAERRKLIQNGKNSLKYLQDLEQGSESAWRIASLAATLASWRTKSKEEKE
ncbi:MAG: hypothetical protein QXI19_11325 [Candidatus Caldarchaeum sp.]